MRVLSADAIINCWITNYMVAFLGSDKFNALTHICSDARCWKYPRDESFQGRWYFGWGSASESDIDTGTGYSGRCVDNSMPK